MPHRPDSIERRLSLVGLMIAGWLASVSAAQAQTDAVGVVVRQSGIVTVLRAAVPGMPGPGDGVLRAAVPGMPGPGDGVFRGDRIVTGPGARLRIALDDGSTVAIRPHTDIAVSRFVVSDDDAITEGTLDLLRGIVRVALVPSATRERFEIRTRTAVTSVRSSDWIVEATDTGASVFVVSGRIAVAATDSGDTVILERDFGTDVAAGQPPNAPKRWDKKRVAHVLKLTD